MNTQKEMYSIGTSPSSFVLSPCIQSDFRKSKPIFKIIQILDKSLCFLVVATSFFDIKSRFFYFRNSLFAEINLFGY